ncbi:MAG: bifunctional folylpolyglutamate synthase/dihydrofolate synthase [Acidimicrobiales bacterium]
MERISDIEHRFGSPAAFARGLWRPWLDAHLNRELGVGALPRGWRDPPSRVAIDLLLEELGQPQHRYERILVAGTNGKTTVTRAASALLHAVGHKVGTFTSPHLDRVNERIGIDGAPISDQALARLIARIAAAETKMSLALSWFEIVTAAALMWFAWQKVDLAVIEVGLGGEYDATAVAMPALVALTNIDLDHTELFGATRPEVASAEATIVSAGHGLVLGESDPSLRGCFTRRLPHPLWVRGVDFGVSERISTSEGQVLTLETPAASHRAVPIILSGAQHAENISIALMVAECATRPIPDPVVREVLSALRAPGRVELVCAEPRVLVDGAHNPAGARALAATLSESFPGDRRTYVIGTSVDKPAAEIVAALGIRPSDEVVCCSAESPRALSAADLVEIVRTALPSTATEAARGVRDAVRRAVDSLPRPELVVVTGSLYVVAEARRMFHDPIGP